MGWAVTARRTKSASKPEIAIFAKPVSFMDLHIRTCIHIPGKKKCQWRRQPKNWHFPFDWNFPLISELVLAIWRVFLRPHFFSPRHWQLVAMMPTVFQVWCICVQRVQKPLLNGKVHCCYFQTWNDLYRLLFPFIRLSWQLALLSHSTESDPDFLCPSQLASQLARSRHLAPRSICFLWYSRMCCQ